MNAAHRICFFLFALLGAAPLHATDLYRPGEIAAADIITPAAFDAVDPDATAARQNSASQKIPAIFRDYFSPALKDSVAAEFSSAFIAARQEFLAAVKKTFRVSKLRDYNLASAAFTNFVADFNVRHKTFPVSPALASEWARNNDGGEIRDNLLSALLQMEQRPLRAAELPESFLRSDLFRLVAVADASEPIPLEKISENDRLVVATNVLLLATARVLFRQNFAPASQPMAAAAAEFLKPNCAPEILLTHQYRGRAVRDLVATVHFAAGQTVVHRGTVIDENNLAFLNAMPKAASAQEIFSSPPVSSLSNSSREIWLIAALVIVSLIAAVALFFVWQLSRGRVAGSQLPARLPTAASFSPQIAEVIKAALVQELAATRVELLKAQRSFSTKNISTNGHEPEIKIPLFDEPADFVSNLVNEGQARLGQNEFEKALKCFDTALALQPGDAETLVKMGGVLEKMERNDEAFACYDRAIAADGTLTIAYLQKGGLLNRLARYAEATQCYEQALLHQDKVSLKNNSRNPRPDDSR